MLDLSWGVAGPIAGMLLADHGADVVKIEPPGGDPWRGTPGYAAWLRGRRSAELDLRAPSRPRTLLRARARRRRGARELRRRARRNGSAIDAPTLLAANPAPHPLLDLRRTAGTPAHKRPPRLRRAGRRAPRHMARATRPLRRRGPAHERSRAIPARARDPRGHGAGLATRGPDLHLHAVAVACAPRSWPPWASAPRCSRASDTGRGQHVETSMLQAALA